MGFFYNGADFFFFFPSSTSWFLTHSLFFSRLLGFALQAPLCTQQGGFSTGAVISFGAWSGNIGGLDAMVTLLFFAFSLFKYQLPSTTRWSA
ncbi:uncharacterized protein J3D65DRAFT_621161 [Phyllosticta citribraziliensis]|uniref:Uncharacterized protein n=1 Tax=Phyllosticta citribraziliensis TaxID=989973 RepID=A0ABR1LWK6_9PEZI